MLSRLKARALILVAVATVAMLLWAPQSTSAEVNGNLPLPARAGLGMVVFSGGSLDVLKEDLFQKGCNVLSIWQTNAEGRMVGYLPTAPAFVGANFLALYPGGIIPPMTPLLVVCQQGAAGGPGPAPVATDRRLVCGPAGNEAVIEIVHWSYYPFITEASSNTAVLVLEYTFPAGAKNASVGGYLKTGLGWPTNVEIKRVLGVDSPLDPEKLGIVTIAMPFPNIEAIADGRAHKATVTTFVMGKAYFEAYALGDIAHGQVPGLTFSRMASALGATNPYALEEPPFVRFSFEAPDGSLWRNDFKDQHACQRFPKGSF